MIELAASDGPVETWLSRPDTEEALPGVLFFMDAIGLRQRIYEMADRIASWGYVVMAPNVFYREGAASELAPREPLRNPEARAAFFADAGPRIARLTSDLALADIDAYVHALSSRHGVTTPIGVVGYCMGARLAVRAAGAHADIVHACGGFHGGELATDDADSPHLALATACGEFVFGHADEDPGMSPDAVRRLGEALSAAGLTASNEIYPGTRHGYTMADTAVYDDAGTERHFEALRDLFARTLG